MDAETQANFLRPLEEFVKKDVKDVAYHRKKMESRRLDYDFKRRKQVTEFVQHTINTLSYCLTLPHHTHSHSHSDSHWSAFSYSHSL